MWLVVVSICTFLRIVFLFFGSMGRGLLSMGKQSIRKICRCPATRCCKKPELLGWDPPPPPPLNKHNRFQYTVPSHIKSCTAHSGEGEGGPRQKAWLFVTQGIWQRKPRFNKQGLYAWLWNGHLLVLILTCDPSIKSVENNWMWHVVQVSNHLLDTESEFAPWDPSKAQILVSTPAHVGTLNSAYWAFSTFQ